MEKVLLIYGGKSVERDISIITGLQVMNAVRNEFKTFAVYIDQDGGWWTCENSDDINIYANFFALAKKPKKVLIDFKNRCVLVKKHRKKTFKPDVALICLHGANGEDGAISGVMQMAGIPYTCPNLTASAVCYDKNLTKILLSYYGLPVVEGVCTNSDEIDKKRLFKSLSFPIIVKPARLGSSVGIAVCKNEKELDLAIESAKMYDNKLLFEKFIENKREFNCAVMVFGDKYILSKPQEIKSKKFYSFDEKYLNEKPCSFEVKSKKLEKELQKLSLQVAKKLECEGIVRVDLLMAGEKLYVNEVNTVPGSLSGYLFGNTRETVVELVENTISYFKEKTQLSFSYQSNALDLFKQSQQMNKYAKK